MSKAKEHSVIYLSPSDDPEREWCEDDVWERSVRYNLGTDFDAAQAELSALREELASRNEVIAMKAREVVEAQTAVSDWARKCKAAEQRNETLAKAATEFMEYAECGWDHFPDVGVNLRAALAQPTESGASE